MNETTSGTPAEWSLPATGPSVKWTGVTVSVAKPSPEAAYIYYGATSPYIRPAEDP